MEKVFVKNCANCGTTFLTQSKFQKHCSQRCRKEHENEQICCRCQNACGNCNWSSSLTPVVGWDAQPMFVDDKEGKIRTYKIKFCPEFIPDKRRWIR